jgi:hypothetical protein
MDGRASFFQTRKLRRQTGNQPNVKILAVIYMNSAPKSE